MKRMHWWTLLGLGGTGLAATMLGPAVWGQPQGKGPAVPPPLVGQAPGGGAKFAVPEPKSADVPGSSLPTIPIVPPVQATKVPPPVPPLTETTPIPPLKAETLPAPAASSAVEKKTAQGSTSDVKPGKQQPSLTIEWSGPPTVRIQQAMACQIVIHNTAKSPVHNVVIRHRLNEGIVFKSSEPKAVNESNELSWQLGTMGAGETRRIDLQIIPQTRGPIHCQATATFTAVAAHQVQVHQPMLAIKMRAPEKIVVGENATLLFTISNPGDGMADAIRAKVFLPEGLEHSFGKIVEFDVGNLAPKEVKSMQLICAAKGAGPQKCTIQTTGEGNLTANDSAQVEILVPKIDVVIAGPKLRYLDRHAIYVLKVTNPGSATASKVELNEQIPIGFKFHHTNHGGKYQESTRQITWTLGDLQPGQSREISVDLIPIETGQHRFLAQAKAANGLKVETEARTLVEGLPSLLMEVSHLDDPIEVGAETSYEIRVANTGTKTETNVEVVCTLPEQLEFRGAKCSTTLRYRQEGRELVFEPLPRLAPKADVIYRVQVKGVAPGDIRFRTRIRADGLKEPVLREESTRVYSDDSPIRAASDTTPAPLAKDPAPKSNGPVVAPPSDAPPRVPVPSETIPLPAPRVPLPSETVPTPQSSSPMPSIPMPGESVPIPAPIPSIPQLLPMPSPPPAAPSVPAPPPLPTPLPVPPGNS